LYIFAGIENKRPGYTSGQFLPKNNYKPKDYPKKIKQEKDDTKNQYHSSNKIRGG